MTKKILFFTGAGLSAESGIPTFRTGDNALWNNYNIKDVCSIDTLHQNKEQIFAFYNELKEQYKNTLPNKAHVFISEIQKKYDENVTIYTSNIDDLLEQAGCTNVYHIHGSMKSMNCNQCHFSWDIGNNDFTINAICPNCKKYKYTKPGVIFFGEQAPLYQEFLNDFLLPIPEDDILKIVIGTSLKVITENMIAPHLGTSILVDPSPSSDNFSISIKKSCTESLDELNFEIEKFMNN